MGNDPSVSVIVPCYNYGRFLNDCIGSVLTQNDVDLRILILDDASTDNSVEIASAYAADPRVELRVHGVNQGHINTYNEGVSWATDTYTVILDADDILTRGSLRRAGDLLNAHPEVSIVYGRVYSFHGDRLPRYLGTARPAWRIWQGSEWFRIRCDLAQNCVLQPGVVMRTSVLKKIGGFRHELPHTADMEMWMRLALHGDVGYIGGTYQALYRIHSAGLHKRRYSTRLADLTQVVAAFERLFRDYKDRIPDHVQLEQLARSNLARRALDSACRLYDTGHPNSDEISGLQDLASATYSDAGKLGEWKSLQWRKRIGPLGCLALRPLLFFTIASRSLRKVQRYRLHRMGLL